MSKSKLNRRQLKKVSKNALRCIERYYGVAYDVDDFFYDGISEWWLSIRGNYGNYDEIRVISFIIDLFSAEWDLTFGFDSDSCLRFENMTFANKINYMIKFLGE